MPQASVVSTRLSPEAHEEILRIAKATKGRSTADVIRELIDQALAHRAEEMTASQFELVSNRLDYLEKRVSNFHIASLMAQAKTLFYTKEHLLLGSTPEQKAYLEEEAQEFAKKYVRASFSRTKERLGAAQEAIQEAKAS